VRHDVAVGKTLVSSSMIDRVVRKLGRELREVPVGSNGLCQASSTDRAASVGRERGASFLRRDGSVWTTDKDGPIMTCLPPRSRANRQRSGRTLPRN